MAELDRLHTLAYATALGAASVDGALVGGWLVTRGVDDARRRRRLRVLLVGAFSAQAFQGDLMWHLLTGQQQRAHDTDRRADLHFVVLGTVSSVVLSMVDRRVPRALARRGVRHPHRLFGAVVGVGYAACALPIHWMRARGRVAALELAAREDAL